MTSFGALAIAGTTSGSLVLGFTVIAFAAWLQYNERRGWDHEPDRDDLEADYLRRRSRSRTVIQALFAVAGGLMIVAAFAPRGAAWIACWMIIMVCLVVIVVLAGVDAFRTRRYYQNRMTEIRRQL